MNRILFARGDQQPCELVRTFDRVDVPPGLGLGAGSLRAYAAPEALAELAEGVRLKPWA